MKHTTSESDVTSLSLSTSTSPPRTPKTPKNKQRPAYYVQSPSRDSHDDGSSRVTTPVYNNSPLDSPSHPLSTGRHSRISSSAGTRYSGFLPSSPGGGSGRTTARNSKRANNKGWIEVDAAIDEESAAGYDEIDDDDEEQREEASKLCVLAFWLSVLVLVFTVVCLVVWGAARQYKPSVLPSSLTVHNLYVGQGTDRTGVPTKLLTLNCSLKIDVHNPSTMFGIHVSSTSVRLMYSEISIADGQFEPFYQPRTSRHVTSVVLHGDKTPLYGAGATLDISSGTGGGAAVPFTLHLAVRTRGDVIGRLVRVSHAKHVTCPVVVRSGSSKPVRFRQSACT